MSLNTGLAQRTPLSSTASRKRLLSTSPYFLVLPFLRGSRHRTYHDVVNRAYSEIFWREIWGSHYRGIARVIAQFLVWPIGFVRALRKIPDSAYREGREKSGKSRTRQTAEQIWLATTHSFSPQEYFMYELYRPERRAVASHYVIRLAFKPLLYRFLDRCLERRGGSSGLDHQDSKYDFYRRCVRWGIPTVPLYARVTSTDVTFHEASEDALPPGDLFVKPESRKGGRGAERWTHLGGRDYRHGDGAILDLTTSITRLQEYARSDPDGEAYLIQPNLGNHPDLGFSSGRSLSTVRMYTVNTGTECVLTHAVLRFAADPTSVVDNFHAGGYAAPIVDLEAGLLGRATRMGSSHPSEYVDAHPTTGEQVMGRRIPLWSQAVLLVTDAHANAEIPRYILGWDVAITSEGAIVVECNGWPDLDIIQRAYREPLGDQLMIRVMADALREGLESMYGVRLRPPDV